MRFTEINLFGVYVAPMSSMMGCRLGGDDRTALVAARFGLTQYVLLAQRHRRRVAAQKASTPKYSGDCLIAERFCGDRGSYHGGSNVEWTASGALAPFGWPDANARLSTLLRRSASDLGTAWNGRTRRPPIRSDAASMVRASTIP